MIKREFLFKDSAGKVILITAGLHGDEHTSVYAVDELIHNLKTKTLRPKNISKIIIYNYINSEGILDRDRYAQNLDLNREFSEICSSNKIVQQIKKDVKFADIVIDVHSSFNSTQFLLLDNDKYTRSYETFLKSINVDYVISPLPNINTLKNYVNTLFKNKIGFTVELNQYYNNIDIASAIKGVQILEKIINNVITCTKSIGKLSLNIAKTLTADLTGLLKINDILGKNVKRGQKLGYVLSLDKSRMINILAPCDGKVVVYPAYMTYIQVSAPIITIQPN